MLISYRVLSFTNSQLPWGNPHNTMEPLCPVSMNAAVKEAAWKNGNNRILRTVFNINYTI
jgi:hypothetical protein